MSDPYNEIVIGLGTVGALMSGVFSWLFKRQVATNDEHDKRLSTLERDVATSEDITQIETKVEHRLDRVDQTLAEGFKEIARTQDATHRRIDELYRDIPKRGD